MSVCGMIVLLLCCLLPWKASANPAQLWGGVRTPAAGPVRIIGSYTAGCIQGAMPLPLESNGLMVIRRSRQRFFGHPLLIQAITELGQRVAAEQLGVVLIGDLAQPRGGPMAYGHRSHQIGLDADVWFWLAASHAELSVAERETFAPPSMVAADRRSLESKHWSPKHARLLQLAAEMPQVARIFVNAAIKKALCTTHAGAPWLRTLRPWWGHDGHFHIRLHCPAGQPDCADQEVVPAGTGCDASLDWWLSDEAFKPQPPREPKPLVLPAACREILQQP